jgi:hypothetical protein
MKSFKYVIVTYGITYYFYEETVPGSILTELF